MKKIFFIIAENYRIAREYADSQGIPINRWVYLWRVEQLLGRDSIHYTIYWHETAHHSANFTEVYKEQARRCKIILL